VALNVCKVQILVPRKRAFADHKKGNQGWTADIDEEKTAFSMIFLSAVETRSWLVLSMNLYHVINKIAPRNVFKKLFSSCVGTAIT